MSLGFGLAIIKKHTLPQRTLKVRWLILFVKLASLSRNVTVLDVQNVLTITKRRQALLIIVPFRPRSNFRTALTCILPDYSLFSVQHLCKHAMWSSRFLLNYPTPFHKQCLGPQATNASASLAPSGICLTYSMSLCPSLLTFRSLSLYMLIVVLLFCQNRPQEGYNTFFCCYSTTCIFQMEKKLVSFTVL